LLRPEQLHQLPAGEAAFARQAVTLLRHLDTACLNAEDLAEAATEHLERHPTPRSSLACGLGSLTGARVLAEIGDDLAPFADGRALKAYAGAAPITRANGKSLAVMHRRVKNQRLAGVGYTWAFAALTASPRRPLRPAQGRGDRHVAAQRNLFHRLTGHPGPLPD
jgi:transposase